MIWPERILSGSERVGLRDLLVFVGIPVEALADFGKIFAGLDGVFLFGTAGGGDSMMKG